MIDEGAKMICRQALPKLSQGGVVIGEIGLPRGRHQKPTRNLLEI